MSPLTTARNLVTAAVASGKIDANWSRRDELERAVARLAEAQARDDARRVVATRLDQAA